MIKVENISKTFKIDGSSQKQIVLRDISFKISKTNFNVIIGKSGSGKSTLINILAGLDVPDKGVIEIFDQRVDKFTPEEFAKYRLENIGIIFQFFNLLPTLSILENVCLPAYLLGLNKVHARKEATILLERVGLLREINKLPNQVSGGEIQRTAIARALINKPKIILADEPTGNLDAKNSDNILRIFKELVEEKEVLTLIATHDSSLIKQADHVLEISDGIIQ